MIRFIIQPIVLGFLLYGGCLFIADLPYILSGAKPTWGIKFSIAWGLVGSLAFLVASLAFFCLGFIFKEIRSH